MSDTPLGSCGVGYKFRWRWAALGRLIKIMSLRGYPSHRAETICQLSLEGIKPSGIRSSFGIFTGEF